MPQAGYYVGPKYTFSNGPSLDIVYTTGVAGKGGHKYWRYPDNHLDDLDNLEKWNTLLWTCVPGKERIKNYTYYATLEEAVRTVRQRLCNEIQ
jgi:hypothetical protein